MTILEALTAVVSVPGVDSLTLEKACIDASLDSAGTYSKDAYAKAVDMAAVDVLKGLIVTSESEGGFSYSISADVLKRRITSLLTKWGEIDQAGPTVKAVSVW